MIMSSTLSQQIYIGQENGQNIREELRETEGGWEANTER